MTAAHSRAAPLLWLIPLAGLVILSAFAARLTGYRIAIAISQIMMGVWLVAGILAVWLYWRRIDEAAQEAQKSAWLWGGGFGMVAGWIADMVMSLPGVYPSVRHLVLNLGGALIVGGGLVAVGAVVGFLIAWAIWWGARR
jgi:hypothetical protein